MEVVRIVTGTALPLKRSDVDTDQIIPAEWLKRVERTGFGRGLFATWRDDRDFVLNDDRFAHASILVAGPNFGTGSSREHAVWALMDYGFAAIVAPSFSDIFRNNCTKNGLVPVEVPPGTEQTLFDAIEADPGLELTVDVERRVLEAPALGLSIAFPLDDAVQERYLQGLDDIGLTVRHEPEITAYEHTRLAWMPTADAV